MTPARAVLPPRWPFGAPPSPPPRTGELDLEALLRRALAPVDPPESLSRQLQQTLSTIAGASGPPRRARAARE